MLLDIHTHRIENALHGEALYNCSMPGAEGLPDVPYCSISIHPWTLTADNAARQEDWADVMVHSSRVLAIGEVGLDKLRGAPLDVQLNTFRRMISLGDMTRLPLIIHNVKASAEIIALKKEMNPRNRWIIHGFRGKAALAEELLSHGLYLSFGEQYQEEALRITPPQRLFLETDESAIPIDRLYERAATVRGISLSEFMETIRENVSTTFLGTKSCLFK